MKLKFLTALCLSALLAFAIGLFTLPWYSYIITSLIVAFVIPQKPSKAFLSGFLSVTILWLINMIIIDAKNEHILSQKMAHMFMLNGKSGLLIAISAILAGLLSGLGALTGSLGRKVVKTN